MALRVGAAVPQFVQQVVLNPANVTANSVSTETFTITGVTQDTQYKVDALSLEAGLFIIGAIPTAANTLSLSIWNTTNADINPASQTFRIIGL